MEVCNQRSVHFSRPTNWVPSHGQTGNNREGTDTNLPHEPLLDDEAAARFLGGIHPKTLQRMARRGEVPAYRVGRFWRYRASELDNWLRVKSNGRIAHVVSIEEKP